MGVRRGQIEKATTAAAAAASVELRIRLPEPLARSLKAAAALKGCSVAAYVAQVLEERIEPTLTVVPSSREKLAGRIKTFLEEKPGRRCYRADVLRRFRMRLDDLTELLPEIGARYFLMDSVLSPVKPWGIALGSLEEEERQALRSDFTREMLANQERKRREGIQ